MKDLQSINFIYSFIKINNVKFEYLRKLKSTNKLESFNYNDEIVASICKKLFTKNIFDLRIMTPIDDPNLQEQILNFLKPNTDGTTPVPSRVRDIDLKLQTPEDTHAVLEALTDNYMIKTVRLSNLSKRRISKETEKLAESLKSSRVGSEIRVSFSNKKFSKSKTSSIEVYYPDAL